MNKLLICAFNLWRQRRGEEIGNIVVLTDDIATHSPLVCERTFAPWKNWAHLEAVHHLPAGTKLSKQVAALDIRPGRWVFVIFKEGADERAVASTVAKHKALPILPHFAPLGTFDNDMIREVSFFDHEFGGKNEWDGKPTVYSEPCLRQLSSVHCGFFYPHDAFAPLIAKAGRRPLKAMDIGCGPVSILRWGALQGDIEITGVDPLLDMYALVLARHGLDALPKLRCDHNLSIFAEEMDPVVPDGEFDIIYTQNALDHTQQPAKVVELMGKKLAPNGIAMIKVAEREGTRQKWDQFHQTDIFFDHGQLMYCHKDQVTKPLLSPASKLRVKQQFPATNDWIACTLEKA